MQPQHFYQKPPSMLMINAISLLQKVSTDKEKNTFVKPIRS